MTATDEQIKAALLLLSPDENGRREAVYEACEGVCRVYKFDAVLRAIIADKAIRDAMGGDVDGQ